MKKHIPNLITLGNLLCGVVAAYYVATGRPHKAAALICLGIVLDFFDGFAARLLKVPSPIGKELDSLADLVTSGIAPAFIAYDIISEAVGHSLTTSSPFVDCCLHSLTAVAFLIPLFAAYRLAKFNLDEEQKHSFKGLPTPANALIWVGLALSLPDRSELLGGVPACLPVEDCAAYTSLYEGCAAPLQMHEPVYGVIVAVLSLVLCILMVCNMRMFSLKVNVKDLTWRSNSVQYIFLIGCAAIVAVTRQWYAISLIIAWYIILSIFTTGCKHEQES